MFVKHGIFVTLAVTLLSATSCEKIQVADNLSRCVEIDPDNDTDPKDLGFADFSLNGEPQVGVGTCFVRASGAVGIGISLFDETCYRIASMYFSEVPLRLGPEVYQLDDAFYKCDSTTVFVMNSRSMHYLPMDHDAALARYIVDPDRSDYRLEITEYNERQNILKGTFSGEFILDDTCWENPAYVNQPVVSITEGYFEVYVLE